MLDRRFESFLLFAGLSLLFSIAYTQAPLYYSNQNQYLLHGLAAAGEGELADDWLANTADPTPVFSGLIALTARSVGPFAFYVVHTLLLGLYALSLLLVFAKLMGVHDNWRLRLTFVAILTLLHSAVARWGSYRLLGWDYPWYLQSGVAGQYVLGGMLQPSMFGVLLLASIAAYLWDRPAVAVGLAAAAAIMHSTYLVAAGMLTLSYMIDQWRSGHRRTAPILGVGALLAVLPSIIYALAMFRPTTPEAFVESQHILARVRIPHHCLPRLWLDGMAAAQLGWIVVGIALSRGTALCFIQIAVLALSAALTMLQVLTDSNTLALLFPWRTSAILVPLATAIVISRLIRWAFAGLQARPATFAAASVLAATVATGVALMWFRVGYRNNAAELPLYEFVRTNREKGDVYLLPVKMPNLAASTRGSLSSDFKPLQERAKDTRIVPIDFQRFRLHAGTPIYVDFKSIPYKDRDVLEWRRRMQWNEHIYEDGVLDRKETLADLDREGVTHIVVTASRLLQSAGLAVVYEDANYKIYRRLK